MKINKILVVCIHNSARSQMTEEYLRFYGNQQIEVESAGLEPGTLNPVVVEVLKEDGIDISAKKTQSVFAFYKEGRQYDYVITVCDETSGQRCPLFPGKVKRLHWSFPDPSAFVGSMDEKRAQTRTVRDAIKEKVQSFLSES